MEETKNTMTILNPQTRKLETYDIHTGELVVMDGSVMPSSLYTYSVELASGICSLIREGFTIKQISEKEGMPSMHLIYAWRGKHPDFKKALAEARADRADYYHDKAVEVIDDKEVTEKDDVPVAKFKFDGFLKLAEKGNPTKYGNQTKVIGDANAPLQIIVNTGIIREVKEPIAVENEHE